MQKLIALEYSPGRFAIYRPNFTLSHFGTDSRCDPNCYYRNSHFVRPMDREQFERERAAWQAIPRLTYQPTEPDSIVEIPFAGFYESIWSGILDREVEQFCECEAEKQTDESSEQFQPEPLRLSESAYFDLVYYSADFSAAHLGIAQDYLSEWDDSASELLAQVIPGFALGARWESMTSPREYNFSTDRIFAYIPAQSIAQLFAYSESTGHSALTYVIRSRFTSYDGFHSFYSNQLSDWIEKPLGDWDWNELGTLLRACIAQAAAQDRRHDSYREWEESIEWEIYENLSESSWQYLDSAMDWADFESRRDSEREEKRAAAIESGELEPDKPAPYRCPYTLDLFAQDSA